MDSYLMMLYVTIEQESALKFFFVEQGWAFCKPDLSVTTDKLGPTTSVLPVVCEETEVFSGEIEPIPKLKVKIPAAKVSTKTAKRKGKRKSIKQTGRSTKLTKIMSSSLGTETNVTGVILDTDDVQNIHSGSAIAAALNAPFTQDELDIHSRSATDDALTFNAPFTVQFEDGNEMQIKVEKVAEDNESAVDDDGDDEDDTDLDYGYEGAVGGDSDVKSKGEVRADESVAKDDDCAPPKVKGMENEILVMRKPLDISVLEDDMTRETDTCLDTSSVDITVDTSWAATTSLSAKLDTDALATNSSSETNLWVATSSVDSVIHTDSWATANKVKEDPIPTETDMYSCNVCNRVYKTKTYLKRHKKQHVTEKECRICGERFSSLQQYKAHIQIHKDTNAYRCTFQNCNRKYTRPDHLRDHFNMHTGMTPYTCSKCNKSFTSKNVQCKHQKFCGNFISCEECGKVVSGRNISDHMKSYHSDVTIYSCARCGIAIKGTATRAMHDETCM